MMRDTALKTESTDPTPLAESVYCVPDATSMMEMVADGGMPMPVLVQTVINNEQDGPGDYHTTTDQR